jgi:hypothetical protein
MYFVIFLSTLVVDMCMDTEYVQEKATTFLSYVHVTNKDPIW